MTLFLNMVTSEVLEKTLIRGDTVQSNMLLNCISSGFCLREDVVPVIVEEMATGNYNAKQCVQVVVDTDCHDR